MIHTITLNPALDYIIEAENFEIGEINQSQRENILPGGKGINVSIILKTLGFESIAYGFISGFVGDEIEKKVKEYGIKTEFIKLEKGNSRINIKITNKQNETAVNCDGPEIDAKSLDLLYKQIEKVEDGDIIILAGSIPKGLSDDVYEQICKKVQNKDIKFVIDTTGDLLLKTLKYHPFLIKPNKHELEDLFNVKIKDKEEIIKYAEKLQEKGARNVLVSMGEMGSVLLDENGYSYKADALGSGKRVNTVGAGDSMVAGFIAGYETFKDYEKALKMGSSAGTATANSLFLATKEEIYKLFKSF